MDYVLFPVEAVCFYNCEVCEVEFGVQRLSEPYSQSLFLVVVLACSNYGWYQLFQVRLQVLL